MIGGVDEKTIHTYLLNADQYKGELAAVSKAIKAEERSEKNLDLVRKELEQTTLSLTRVTGALSDSLTGKVTAANLASAAIQKLAGFARDAITDIDAYSQAVNIYSGNLDGAREATMGLVGDLELMQAKNKLATLGVKMTDEEFNKLLGSLTKLAPAMGVDLKFALDSATTMLARKSVAVADNIGVVIKAEEANKKWAEANGKLVKDMTDDEKTIAFRTDAIAQMEKKAAATAERIDTLTDAFHRLWVKLKNLTVEAGNWINTSRGMIEQFDGQVLALERIRTGITKQEQAQRALTAAGNEYKKTLDEIWNEEVKLAYMRGATVKGGGGLGEEGAEFELMKQHRSFFNQQYSVPAGQKFRPPKAAKRKAKDESSSHDFEPDVFGDVDITSATDMTEALQDQIGAWGALPDAIDNVTGSFGDLMLAQDTFSQDVNKMVLGSIKGLTLGMVGVFDAMIQGTESFGSGMAKLLRTTAFGIMAEAAAHAIKMAGFAMEWSAWSAVPIVGQAWVPAASMGWASVAKWSAIAAGAGLVGLGASALAKAASPSGGSSAGAGGRTQGAHGLSSNHGGGYSPKFGKAADSDQPLVFYVMIGDPNDGSSATLITKQIQVKMKQAA